MTNDKLEEKITETYFSKLYYKKFYEQIIFIPNKKETLKIISKIVMKKLDEIILEMCNHYLLLTGINIENPSPNLFEFIEQILIDGKKNPYLNSFLFALNCFQAEYFSLMSKGNPSYITGGMSEDTKDSGLEVVTNSENKLIWFDNQGINEIESCRIINKMVYMERYGQIGPMPKVRQKIRTDI